MKAMKCKAAAETVRRLRMLEAKGAADGSKLANKSAEKEDANEKMDAKLGKTKPMKATTTPNAKSEHGHFPAPVRLPQPQGV